MKEKPVSTVQGLGFKGLSCLVQGLGPVVPPWPGNHPRGGIEEPKTFQSAGPCKEDAMMRHQSSRIHSRISLDLRVCAGMVAEWDYLPP